MKSEKLVTIVTRRDFRAFASNAFRTLNRGDSLSDDPYVGVLCYLLQRVARGKIQRQLINLPPRHAKTLLATVCLAAFVLGHHPERRIIIVCYGAPLAREIAHKIREILRSNWFKKAFRCRMSDERSSAKSFVTTAGGGLIATWIGGQIQGRGADLIIVDDPNRTDGSESADRRAEIQELFETDVETRMNDHSSGQIVVVAHRTGEDDLCGFLLERGGWQQLCLPFLAEEETVFRTDVGLWTRRVGDLLRPRAFPIDRVERIKASTSFRTLYQQDPRSITCTLEEEDFATFRAAPLGVNVISVDPAYGTGSHHAFSALQVWCRVEARHHLLYASTIRLEPVALRKEIIRLAKRFWPGAILIEADGAGSVVAAEVTLAVSGSGIKVFSLPTNGRNKSERLAEALEVLRPERIFLPADAPWSNLFIEEVVNPDDAGGRDHIDAISQYLLWAHQNVAPPAPKPRCLGLTLNSRGVIRIAR